MTTTSTAARTRGAGRAGTTALDAKPVERPPALGLDPIGEFLRRVADEHVPGAVQVDPYRQHGAPVLDDTRIPVCYVLDQLAAGRSWTDITAGYPEVTEARIRAALDFAAAVIRQPQAVDLD
jgi:uncharacterized protein (DUF433 family)